MREGRRREREEQEEEHEKGLEINAIRSTCMYVEGSRDQMLLHSEGTIITLQQSREVVFVYEKYNYIILVPP